MNSGKTFHYRYSFIYLRGSRFFHFYLTYNIVAAFIGPMIQGTLTNYRQRIVCSTAEVLQRNLIDTIATDNTFKKQGSFKEPTRRSAAQPQTDQMGFP